VSRYHLVLGLIIFYIATFSLLKAKELMPVSDDELIMRGLLYDDYKAYENSRQIYARLFDTTEAEIYLFKEATASLLGKTHIHESIKRLKLWENKHPNTAEVQRLLIPLYLTVNQVKSAKIQAEYLLEYSTNSTDLELASNPFLYTSDFKRALDIFKKIYMLDPKEEILLRIVDIMNEYTNERLKAIQLLESYRRMHVSSNKVLVKLIAMYGQERDIDGLLATYKVLYNRSKDETILTNFLLNTRFLRKG